MPVKNFEILGRKWDFGQSVEEALQSWPKNEASLASNPDCDSQSAVIQSKLSYPVIRHLGFGPIGSAMIRAEAENGFDMAVRYFDDVWWRPERMAELDLSEEDRSFLHEHNRFAMDKNNPDRKLCWFKAFTSALFLGGLLGRWDDLAMISGWFDATIEPEYTAGQLEEEYMQLFVCIAGGLRSQPMPGADGLLTNVRKCRAERPRLLCAAWEAAIAADQAAFDNAFAETVKHFLSKPENGQVYHWVAIDQSSVWLIAEHCGLKLPPLTDKLQAAVVTRESAGLAH